MAKSRTTVSLLKQIHHEPPQLYTRIKGLLATANLERFRVAAAYARWDGIGLIASQIENFLAEGGEFQSIYGVSNGGSS
jgi:hypothetical protein